MAIKISNQQPMIELINNYTEPILAFITGGGLLSFVTVNDSLYVYTI